mgnify:CR=1 FL=1
MKNKFIYGIALAALVSACGTPEVANESLDALNSKRDSLKAELIIVSEQIQEMDTSQTVSVPLVTTSEIKIEKFVHKVEVPGTVETDKNSLVNSEANGVIKQIHVKEGQKVSKGQALITIDSEILASTIQEMETALELADYMFEKQEKLKDQGVGIEIEYEQAKNQKISLERKLKTMRSQKGKSVVRAPFSGIIDDLMVNEGEMAAPQFPLLRIVNNSSVTVNASLSENLLSKVHLGTAVEMVFPSLNDTTIISAVSNKGNYIDPVNRTFRIQMDVKKNTLLLPNLFAKVKVTDFVRMDAMVISTETILQDTDNNNYIYRLIKISGSDTYDVEKVMITVVKKFQGMACIEGDINEGDSIVLKGAKGITEADIVKIQ